MTGTLATYLIAAMVVLLFLVGARKIYRSFVHGEADCCGSGGTSCSGCSGCASGRTAKK